MNMLCKAHASSKSVDYLELFILALMSLIQSDPYFSDLLSRMCYIEMLTQYLLLHFISQIFMS